MSNDTQLICIEKWNLNWENSRFMHLKTKLWTQKLKRLLENNLEPEYNKKIFRPSIQGSSRYTHTFCLTFWTWTPWESKTGSKTHHQFYRRQKKKINLSGFRGKRKDSLPLGTRDLFQGCILKFLRKAFLRRER